ncbi:hypothetical protein T261_2200 [Streptomyces lydicus]|nr:hypothetical protein T261_2200 [Streptomyces lydicus]
MVGTGRVATPCPLLLFEAEQLLDLFPLLRGNVPVALRQAAPRVRASLAEAVAARIDERPVSADLAGLDSTTLACLAARRGPVAAMTYADERLRDDDLAYATRTAATVAGLEHHTVPGAKDRVYYAGLHDLTALAVTDAPNAYVVTASIKRAVLDTVTEKTRAPGVHFTGAGGDAVLSAPSSYLADLLRERQHRRALSHAVVHARLRHTSAFTVLARVKDTARTDLAAVDDARAVLDWLTHSGRTQFKAKDVVAGSRRFKTVASGNATLTLLEEHGYVRAPRRARRHPGPPTRSYVRRTPLALGQWRHPYPSVFLSLLTCAMNSSARSLDHVNEPSNRCLVHAIRGARLPTVVQEQRSPTASPRGER